MDPQTVLRFVRSCGAWPGRVVVIACEPAEVQELGLGLSAEVQSAVERAVELVLETAGELRASATESETAVSCARAPPGNPRSSAVHELSLSGAVINTAVKHADGRRVSLVSLRVGRLRQVVPDTLEFYFEFVARGTLCEGARLEQEIVEASLRCEACEREWEIEFPAFRCPTCGGADVEVTGGNEFEVSQSRSRRPACIAQR